MRISNDKVKVNLFIWILYTLGMVIWLILNVSGERTIFTIIKNDPLSALVNIFFFGIIFIIFFLASKCLKRGAQVQSKLEEFVKVVEKVNSREKNKEQIWSQEDIFSITELDTAFARYKQDYDEVEKTSPNNGVNIEDYINYDLAENITHTYFLDQVSATMTGLGILGTFVGLSIGLSTFSLTGTTSAEVETNIQPLMEGIKVAFHTSIIGLVYSIIFNFFYRNYLVNIRSAVDMFIRSYEKYVVPSTANGSVNALFSYQQRIVEVLEKQEENHRLILDVQIEQSKNSRLLLEEQKRQTEISSEISNQFSDKVANIIQKVVIPELQKVSQAVEKFANETHRDQQVELEKIVDNFVNKMNEALGSGFDELAETINQTNVWQKKTMDELQEVLDRIKGLGYDLISINEEIQSAIGSVNNYVSTVEEMQGIVNQNLMDLNVQTEVNNEAINAQTENLNTIVELESKMSEILIQFTEETSQQAKAIKEMTNAVKESSKAEIEMYADTAKKYGEQLVNQCMEFVGRLSVMTKETEDSMAKSFDVLQEEVAKKIRQIESINSTISNDITKASEILGKSAEKLGENMENRVKETFVTFDNELAEITRHLASTLDYMKRILERVPGTVDDTCESIEVKFDTMQKMLDQYLEYADKLHRNIESKWQMFKNFEMKEE